MRPRTVTPWISLALALLTACPGLAAGRGYRSPSVRHKAAGYSATPNHVAQRRLGDSADYQRPYDVRDPASYRGRYRRSPDYARQRIPQTRSQSTLRRMATTAIGYDVRDSLVRGAGARNARRFDSPRDQRIAQQRGQRVVGYSLRVGNALRRVLSP